MRLLVTIILFVGFLVHSSSSVASFKKSEYLLEMLSEAYESGNYRIGLSRTKDLQPVILKEEGGGSVTIGHVHAWKAVLYASLSKFGKYHSELDSAKSILAKHQKDSVPVQEAYLTLAAAEAAYGNYQSAIEILEENYPNSDSVSSLFYSYAFKEAKYRSEIGFLVDAETELHCDRELVESIKDTAYRFKILRAKMLFLHFDILLEKGEYYRCYQLLEGNVNWVEETFEYKNGILAELILRRGRLFYQKRNYKEANSLFKRAYSLGMKYYALYAPFFITLQQERISNLLISDKLPEAEYWINDLDVRVLSYYGRQSTTFLDHKLSEVENDCDLGDWNSASSRLTTLLNRNKNYPEDHFGQIRIKKLAYQIQLEQGNIKQADSSLFCLLSIAENLYGKEAPFYHQIKLDQLIFQYTFTNQIRGLEKDYKESLYGSIKYHLSDNNEAYYHYVYGLVDLYNVNEAYNKANELIESLLVELRGNTKIVKAQALSLSAKTKVYKGDYNQSLAHIKKALWIFKDVKLKDEKVMYADAFRVSASLNKAMGKFSSAETAYNNADRLFSDQIISFNKTLVEENAWLLVYQGRYRKTAKAIKNRLEEKKISVGTDHYSNIELLLTLAEIDMQLGEFASAEEYIKRAEEITLAVFGHQSEKFTKVLLAYKEFCFAIGDFQKSEEKVVEAVDVLTLKFGDEHIKTAIPKSELALAIGLNHKELQENGNVELKGRCLILLESSESTIQTRLGIKNSVYATVLENSGKFNLIIQELENASENIKNAREIWSVTLGEPNLHTAQLDYLLGEIAFFDTTYSKALSYFDKSKEGYKSLFGTHHPDYVESLGMSARMSFILDEKSVAIEKSEEVIEKSLSYIHTIFPSLSERGKSNYWSKVKEHFEFFNTLVFTEGENNPNLIGKAYDVNLQTKAILLNSSLKTKNYIMQSGDTVLINAFEKWLDKKDLLIAGVSMEYNERRKEGIDLVQLESEIEGLEKYLGEQAISFNDLKTNSKAYKWQDLTDVLQQNEHAVEIIAFRVFDKGFSDSIWYAVMEVNTKTKGSPSFSLIKNGEYLHNQGIAYYRNCMKFNISDALSYTNFWQPIESLVTENAKVYVSFDGVYNRLNLETIKLPSKDIVLNNYKIIPIGTTRDLLEREVGLSEKQPNSATFVGNPTFYSPTYTGRKSWSQLKGTEIEVSQLSASLSDENWKTVVYKNNEATEASVKGIHSPRVLHIATHGYYIEDEPENDINKVISNTAANPLLRSGILLKNGGELYEGAKAYEFNRSDGVLTAYEAMNLDLGNTDLVVLSACETGLGQVELGEGVFGLQRSFVVAGANSIILSLFKVSDDVTTTLMTSFYKNWNMNLSKQEAFVAAKKEIMSTYKNPKFWGAFVMIGSE